MMKKIVWMLVLAAAVFAAGCARQTDNIVPGSPTAETMAELDAYMASVKKQSDAIRAYLEHEASTQADMNMKSRELSDLWNGALDHVWTVVKDSLPTEEAAKLELEQQKWLTEKTKAVEEAGKEFEGGSIYPLIVNGEVARLAEERTCRLYDRLKETNRK